MLHSLFPMTREVVCHPDPTDQTLLSQPGNNNVRNWGKERWGWLEQEIIRYFSGQYLIKSLKSISTSLPSLKYFSLLLFSLLIFVLTTGYLSASHTEIYTPRLSQVLGSRLHSWCSCFHPGEFWHQVHYYQFSRAICPTQAVLFLGRINLIGP